MFLNMLYKDSHECDEVVGQHIFKVSYQDLLQHCHVVLGKLCTDVNF